MKQFSHLLFILSLPVLLSTCKPEEDPLPDDKIYFTGYTWNDVNGVPIEEDTTDWRIDDVWMGKESGLFSVTKDTTCTPSFAYKVSGFPNPCEGVFHIYQNMPAGARMEMKLVDENFNVLFAMDTLTVHKTIAVDLRASGIKDTVRLYYKFVENNCEFRGHGDMLIR